MYYTLAEKQDFVRSDMQPTLWPAALMLTGNARAHRWLVTVFNDGQPVDLTGATAIARFRREADDVTVVQTATVDGNSVWVLLAPDCYRYAGRIKGMMEITTGTGDGAATVTVKVTYFTVLAGAGDAVSDPENVIPSLAEILAQLGAMTDATDACEQATLDAQDATDDAQEMAERAAGAAAALEGLTATANTLATEAPATVTVQTDAGDGHYQLTFGLPRGPQGVRGTQTYSGTAITGNSSSPTAYATGIAAALPGDRYRYNGLAVADVGNEYVCTVGGDAAAARWVFDCNVRGTPGNGTVNGVDLLTPDENGMVTLDALRFGIDQTGDYSAAAREMARANVGAAKATAATATLPTAGWSGSGPYTYAATVAAVAAANIVIAAPAPASKAAYEDCGAYASAQGAGTLTFTAENIPTSEITVNVTVIDA